MNFKSWNYLLYWLYREYKGLPYGSYVLMLWLFIRIFLGESNASLIIDFSFTMTLCIISILGYFKANGYFDQLVENKSDSNENE